MKQKLTALVLALVMAFSLAPATSATTNSLENIESVGAPYRSTEENERNFRYAQELAAEIIGDRTDATAYEKAKMFFV